MRGYNLSDKPKGVENYDMRCWCGDVIAVVKHLGPRQGDRRGARLGRRGRVALRNERPEMVEKLIIVNLPHPRGLMRELANNPQQQKNSQYARNFQTRRRTPKLTPEALANFCRPRSETKYIEAFRKSDFEAMLNYYKRNYPREPYTEAQAPLPKVQAPVLMFHGLKDTALLAGALNNTWEWVDQDLTIVTIPGAGHWSHWEASDLVTKTMASWLGSRSRRVWTSDLQIRRLAWEFLHQWSFRKSGRQTCRVRL